MSASCTTFPPRIMVCYLSPNLVEFQMRTTMTMPMTMPERQWQHPTQVSPPELSGRFSFISLLFILPNSDNSNNSPLGLHPTGKRGSQQVGMQNENQGEAKHSEERLQSVVLWAGKFFLSVFFSTNFTLFRHMNLKVGPRESWEAPTAVDRALARTGRQVLPLWEQDNVWGVVLFWPGLA
jgi:hypothetical protein